MKSTRNADGYWVCYKNKHKESDERTFEIQRENNEAVINVKNIITESLNNEHRKWIQLSTITKKSGIPSHFFLTELRSRKSNGVVELSAPAKKWRFRMAVRERLRMEYDNTLELYNTYKAGDYNVFRLMNPYEGGDKDFYNADTGKTKSRRDSMKIYTKLAELESELSPKFVYLRGDQFAGGTRENKAGVILVADKYVDYVNASIVDVHIGDGTSGSNYWLEPFNPPHGSFIKERIQKEAERKKSKIPSF